MALALAFWGLAWFILGLGCDMYCMGSIWGMD